MHGVGGLPLLCATMELPWKQPWGKSLIPVERLYENATDWSRPLEDLSNESWTPVGWSKLPQRLPSPPSLPVGPCQRA